MSLRKAAVPLLAVAVACSSADSPQPPDPKKRASAPIASVTTAPTPSLGEARAADLRGLLEGYEQIHPRPYHAVDKARVDRFVAGLTPRLGNLNEAEFLVATMRLVALLAPERDGHMWVSAGGGDDAGSAPAWPLRLYRFSDGIFVVDALKPHRHLIGQRVVAVGGVPWRDAWRRFAQIASRDNAMTLWERLPNMFVMPRILHGLGISDERGGPLTLKTAGGRRHHVMLESISEEEYAEAFGVWSPLSTGVPPSKEIMAFHARERGIWLKELPDRNAIYIGYNSGESSTSSIAARLRRIVRTDQVRRIVIDLRQNAGGETAYHAPLVDALKEIDHPGMLYAILGRATFSAAINFVMELRRSTSIVTVGEEPGGAPIFFSDGVAVDLPNSGLWVDVATIRWNSGGVSPSEFPDNLIKPDIPVDYSSSEYFQGRDPALEAALTADA